MAGENRSASWPPKLVWEGACDVILTASRTFSIVLEGARGTWHVLAGASTCQQGRLRTTLTGDNYFYVLILFIPSFSLCAYHSNNTF
jgi:hypothetical protein